MIEEFVIPIFTGIHLDIRQFDFSFKDISIFDFRSKEFKNYLNGLQAELGDEVRRFMRGSHKKIHFPFQVEYAIVKNNPHSDYNYQDFHAIIDFLLIICPSDIHLFFELGFDVDNGRFRLEVATYWDKVGSLRYQNFNDSPIENLPKFNKYEVEEFAKLYFKAIKHSYINVAVGSYVSYFRASHLHFRYLSLFMALESTVDGANELSYRLKRNVAILCGDNKLDCFQIYKFLTTTYSLRSKVTHGEKPDFDKIEKYTKPLEAIVSRSIIELIVHNISTCKEFNEITTGLGFGQRNEISKGWSLYTLNEETLVNEYFWITHGL